LPAPAASTARSGRNGTHEFADGEISAFDAWVRNGGGVMTTIGYTGDEAKEVVNVNRLLAPLGMGYSATSSTSVECSRR